MPSARLGAVELDLCLPCGSVWFDRGEIAEVVRAGGGVVGAIAAKLHAGKQADRGVAAAPRCPTCQAALARVEYPSMPGVPLECCGQCQGFWVRSDALLGIAARLPGGTAAPAAGAPAPTPPAAPAAAAAPLPPPGPAAKANSANSSAAAVKEKTCPDCKQPNDLKAMVCWGCGRNLKDLTAGVPCPRCEGALRHVDGEGAELSACEGCGGVWLQQDSLKTLIFHPEDLQQRIVQRAESFRTGRQGAPHADLHCARCGVPMTATTLGTFSKKPVDRCPGCSACFLDQGGLRQILLGTRG